MNAAYNTYTNATGANLHAALRFSDAVVACPAAHIKLKAMRSELDMLMKCYGSRYLDKLAAMCGYRVVDGNNLVLGPGNATRKEFKTKKECGEWMEGTIVDLYQLGILK